MGSQPAGCGISATTGGRHRCRCPSGLGCGTSQSMAEVAQLTKCMKVLEEQLVERTHRALTSEDGEREAKKTASEREETINGTQCKLDATAEELQRTKDREAELSEGLLARRHEYRSWWANWRRRARRFECKLNGEKPRNSSVSGQ